MPFSTRIIVRFGDTDPAGLVYCPHFFHYFHIALEDFFARRCGISYQTMMAEENIGFPTVRVDTEFFTPLVYGDEAEIEVFVSRTGRSSACFEYSLRRASDGTLCARSRQIQVCMDLSARRSVPIPEKYRRAFTNSAD